MWAPYKYGNVSHGSRKHQLACISKFIRSLTSQMYNPEKMKRYKWMLKTSWMEQLIRNIPQGDSNNICKYC